jgi:hypothetical protein
MTATATRHATTTDAVVLRPARPEDTAALVRLAVLDSARPLTGDVLVAEHDGVPRAALALDTGRAIADPFHPTTDLVALLRSRAETPRRTGRSGATGRRLMRRSFRRAPAC